MGAQEKYDQALATYGAAFQVFYKVKLAYMAQTVDDAEFLAARSTFDKAQQALDAAEVELLESCKGE